MPKNIETLKKIAAEKAVEFVESDMVVGLGAGSTAHYSLIKISEEIRNGSLKNIIGIPCSNQVEQEALKYAIPLKSFSEVSEIDITIDGADEVDKSFNLIKGGGGALLREKIIAEQSKLEIIIIDEGKLSSKIGTNWALPVEVLPFAKYPSITFIEKLGAKVTLRKSDSQSTFYTDQDNLILDCDFGPIHDPISLSNQLNNRAGIIAHGLFLDLATDIIIAGESGVRHLKK